MKVSFTSNQNKNTNNSINANNRFDWVRKSAITKPSTGKNNVTAGVLSASAALFVLKHTLCSSIPRILGLRLESHSTSKAIAEKIIQNGCILDPKYGGSGAATAMSGYKEVSENFVHITGLHKDFDILKTENIFARKAFTLYSLFYKKLQPLMYRGLATYPINPNTPDNKKPFLLINRIIKGIFIGKTFYIAGTDDYFNSKFIPDKDDIALKANQKLKVYTSRIAAIKSHITENGLLNPIKNAKTKALKGIALAITGLSATYFLAKKAYNSFRIS